MTQVACGIDIGGSGVKGALVDLGTGEFIGERVRIETPRPSTPEAVAKVCRTIIERLGVVERVGRALQDPGHELVDVHALPGLVEIGHEDDGAAHDGGGDGDAHGHVLGDWAA